MRSVVLDEQALEEMLGGNRRCPQLEGELRLCLAMIELAIEDIITSRNRRRAHGHTAWRWIATRYEHMRDPDIRTFVGCCEMLGLDPDAMRERIEQLKPRDVRAPRMNHGRDRTPKARRARIVKLERQA